MFAGMIAGMTWALETVVLGIALGMSPFCSTEQAIFLAPFVSTFLHDACSAIWATRWALAVAGASTVPPMKAQNIMNIIARIMDAPALERSFC